MSVPVGGRSLDREQMNREFAEASVVSLLWLVVLAASSLAFVNLAGSEFTYLTRRSESPPHR